MRNLLLASSDETLYVWFGLGHSKTNVTANIETISRLLVPPPTPWRRPHGTLCTNYFARSSQHATAISTDISYHFVLKELSKLVSDFVRMRVALP